MRALIRIMVAAALCWSPLQAADLEDLDFMTGIWRQDAPGGPIEEYWMPAAANTKVAAFRWVNGEKIVAIELVIVSAEDDGTFMRFKHYSADFIPWEKDEPNVYRLISAADGRAEFRQTSENSKAPQTLIYERTGNSLKFRGTNHSDLPSHEKDLVLVFEKVE